MSNKKDIDFASIWSVLSKVDCSDHIETKMNLSYLSWAWAWGILMENYPIAEYAFAENQYARDESVMVECTVTIEGHSRTMWLPVMDNRNNSILNPSTRQISDAKMRCLVKCLAMFGLGHYIYAGEDLPNEQTDKGAAASKKKVKPKTTVSSATEPKASGVYNTTDQASWVYKLIGVGGHPIAGSGDIEGYLGLLRTFLKDPSDVKCQMTFKVNKEEIISAKEKAEGKTLEAFETLLEVYSEQS